MGEHRSNIVAMLNVLAPKLSPGQAPSAAIEVSRSLKHGVIVTPRAGELGSVRRIEHSGGEVVTQIFTPATPGAEPTWHAPPPGSRVYAADEVPATEYDVVHGLWSQMVYTGITDANGQHHGTKMMLVELHRMDWHEWIAIHERNHKGDAAAPGPNLVAG